MAIKWSDGTVTHAGMVTGYIHTYMGDGDYFDSVEVWDGTSPSRGPGCGSSYPTDTSKPYVTGYDVDIYDGPAAGDFAAYKAARAAHDAANMVDAFWMKETKARVGAKVTMAEPTTRGKNAHVKAGATGTVIWLGPNNYDRWSKSETARCGVRLDDSDEVVWGDTFRWAVDIDADTLSDWYAERTAAAAKASAAELAKAKKVEVAA